MQETKISLDVYRDPWVDANFVDGHKERLSLHDCIVKAKDIKSLYIADAKFALDHAVPYTMLTLILARVFMPNQDNKLEMLETDSFDIDKIDAYIADCEKNGISFDVFDEHRPFLQNSDYQKFLESKPKSKTVGMLEPLMVSGNNTVFYHNRQYNTNGQPVQDTLRMTPSQFIVSVARNYMYHNGSGQSCATGYAPANPPLHCIIHGRNLYETLIISIPRNLCGVPLWERRFDMTVPEITERYGHLDYISAAFLPTVSIRFAETEDGKVKSIWYSGNIYKERDKEKPNEFADMFKVKSETAMNMLFLKSNKKTTEDGAAEYYPAGMNQTADITTTKMQIMQSFDKTGDPGFMESAIEEGLIGTNFQFVIYGGLLTATGIEPFGTVFDIPIPAVLLKPEVTVQVKRIVKYVEIAASQLHKALHDMEREISMGNQLKESGTIRTIVRHFSEYACDELVPNENLHGTWIEQIIKEPTDKKVINICEDICFKAREAFYSYRTNDIRVSSKYAVTLNKSLKGLLQGETVDD